MKSDKSKMLGALLSSEQCHDEFEAFYLQYSYNMAHIFYLAFCLSCGFFLCLKRNLFKQVCFPMYFEGRSRLCKSINLVLVESYKFIGLSMEE